jgi:hypothetical protein
MDRQTKHEIWLLAIGTIIFEVPVVAVAALAIWATKIARPEALGFFSEAQLCLQARRWFPAAASRMTGAG